MLKINMISTYSTNCNTGKFLPIPPHTNRNSVLFRLLYPPWVFLSPFIKLWKGEFFKEWILDVGDGIFPNRMREGEGGSKLISHVMKRRGGTFFYFLAILSLIYIMLEILIYRWGECLNRVNFWYLPLGSFSYIYKTWWYF